MEKSYWTRRKEKNAQAANEEFLSRKLTGVGGETLQVVQPISTLHSVQSFFFHILPIKDPLFVVKDLLTSLIDT